MLPGTDAFAHVVERHRAGEPVSSTAPSLHEVVYGWSRRDDQRARASLRVLLEAVVAGVVLVLPLTAEAAILAGRLRAAGREPPAARPGDGRTKAERRMSWRMDMLIAATAYVHGRGVATTNGGDFERIAALLRQAAPGGPPLDVVPAPFR